MEHIARLWHIRPDTEARKRSGFDLFTARFGPQGVERARLVHTLVGVGAEVVTLALDKGGRQTLGTQAIEVGQRGCERRSRRPLTAAWATTLRQDFSAFFDGVLEVRGEQQ